MNLSDLFPDADAMLELEPEDLAMVLLGYAQRRRGQYESRDGVIFHVPPLPHSVTSGSSSPDWPSHLRAQITVTMAAALAWLKRELLIAEVREQNTVNGLVYMFTRRGAALSTEEAIAGYRHASLLPRNLVHPSIAGRVVPMTLRGDHDVAVVQAFKAVEVAVRAAAGLPADLLGVNLMRRAFHQDAGPLTDKNLPTAEREAEMHLFASAIGHAKNPGSHREVAMDQVEAARLILFASYLLTLVERRAQVLQSLAEATSIAE